MGLYNFQSRFVEKILSGEKTHTIRATRKFLDVPGCTMHLYTGLRTKQARLLMRVPCVKRETVYIGLNPAQVMATKGVEMGLYAPEWYHVQIDGQILDFAERELLATRDGFTDFQEMMQFWRGRLPFDGHIYHWKTGAA
jgi:hypothetical protein